MVSGQHPAGAGSAKASGEIPLAAGSSACCCVLLLVLVLTPARLYLADVLLRLPSAPSSRQFIRIGSALALCGSARGLRELRGGLHVRRRPEVACGAARLFETLREAAPIPILLFGAAPTAVAGGHRLGAEKIDRGDADDHGQRHAEAELRAWLFAEIEIIARCRSWIFAATALCGWACQAT